MVETFKRDDANRNAKTNLPEPIYYVSREWVPRSRANISIFDSGLLFGDTITEAIRTFGRIPYEQDRHLERFARSARLARVSVEEMPGLKTLIAEMLERNSELVANAGEVFVRLEATRGILNAYREKGKTYPDSTTILWFHDISFRDLLKKYERGIAIAYPSTRQIPDDVLDPRIKHRSRMYRTLADMEAADIDPEAVALLLDPRGRIAEGVGWNVFAVHGRRVATPGSDVCLEGISRAVVLELCADLGLEPWVGSLWPYDIASADEVFATASSYCIAPITRVHGTVVGDGRPGKITRSLLEAWSKRIGLDIVGQAREYAARL